jgi:hypothetical protein
LYYSVDPGEARQAFDTMYSHLTAAEKGALDALYQDSTLNLHIQMGTYDDDGFDASGGAYQVPHFATDQCKGHPQGNYDSKYSAKERDLDAFFNWDRMSHYNHHHDDVETPDSLMYHEIFGHFFPEVVNKRNGGRYDEGHANERENAYRIRLGLTPTK